MGNKRETGKGLFVGTMMATAIAGVMKLFDKHLSKKEEKKKGDRAW